MKDKDINKKRRFLEYLEDYEIKNLGYDIKLSDLKENLRKEINYYDADIIVDEAEVINKFTGAYLKILETDNPLFGEQLKVVKVTSIEIEGYNTDYERMYKCKGEILSFTNNHIFCNPLERNRLMSEKNIREYEVIDEGEYRDYKFKYDNFKKMMSEILDD